MSPPSPRPFHTGRLARSVGNWWARWSYARHIEPTWLEATTVILNMPPRHATLSGLRVAHLSDLHAGEHISLNYLIESIELAQEWKPDLFVLTGDYVHKGHGHVAAAAQLLGSLDAPLGTVAVLGNHDYSIRSRYGRRKYPRLADAVADALAAEGIEVLRNASTRREFRGETLVIHGLDDFWSGDYDTAKSMCCPPGCDGPDVYRIVLTHNPESIAGLEAYPWDLLLCGHTHGGQVSLPKWGPIALGKKARAYAAGLYRIGDRVVYVNRGIGHGSIPLRYQVRPEIALLQFA